jgi:Fe-S cluster biogenesis protein NfuA
VAADDEVGRTGARIEELLGELRSSADPEAAERAEELVGLLVRLYGAGLVRVVELATADGGACMDRLTGDPLVASLLVLHDLHPVPAEERIHAALEGVRPYLGSHAGGVEYLGLDEDGVVHLRLQGTCDGCPSSVVTVKTAIERAILEKAPEVVAVEVEGMVEPGPEPAFIPLGSVGLKCPTALEETVA